MNSPGLNRSHRRHCIWRVRSLHLFLPMVLLLYFAFACPGLDQPQWGQAWSRNMISSERNLPERFDPGSKENIKWSVQLGTQTHSSPVIAGGKVYIGTNNGHPRDPRHSGDRGVLMCFEESSGQFLWQLVVPKREEDIYFDWPDSGIASPVTVESNRVYVVSNRGEVLCLDPEGLRNGNDGPFQDEGAHMRREHSDTGPEPGPADADILWCFDLTAGAGIWSHDAAHSSILIHGDCLDLNTGTGVDNTHRRIRTPDAPSLVVLDKYAGTLIARDNEHIAPKIFHSTWSAPSMATLNGSLRLFFAAGNGLVYAFRPLDRRPGSAAVPTRNHAEAPQYLEKIWSYDFDPAAPKTNVHKYVTNRRVSPSNFYGMPVFANKSLYVAGGGDIWWGKNEAWLKCIDPSGSGDITATATKWTYALKKHVLSTPAVGDGLVFIADCGGAFHCVDANTGQPLWTHEVIGEVWASPLLADGKVYVGSRRGMFYVFKAAREKRVLSVLDLGSPISATAAAANGTLYVATMNRLYACAKANSSAAQELNRPNGPQ